MNKARALWTAMKRGWGMVILALFFAADPAYALNATFDFEAATGTITPDFATTTTNATVTQVNTASGETLQAVATSAQMGSMQQSLFYVIAGNDSLASALGIGETSITFSLVSGNTFDLTSIALNNRGTDTTVTLASSKGSLSTTLVNGATSTLNVAANANAAAMQGITSFTVTAMDTASSAIYYLAFDDITLANIGGAATTPSAPTITGITAGNGQLSVAFTAGADGGSALTNYEYSIDGGTNFTALNPTSTTSPIVITGLTNGTTYQVQIRAVNANGAGTATASTTGTPVAPVTYTVTYNGNGNTGGAVPTDFSSPYTSGATVTVLDNTGALVKTGNTFAGWSTAAPIATPPIYTAGATFTIAANTTLYANWIANAPSATTSAASGMSKTGATLNGTVNDNGLSTTVSFEYGTTNAYGSTVTATPSTVGAASGATAVSAALSLSCGTTYHFRVTATSAGGTTNGSDATFSTSACQDPQTISFTNPGTQNFGTTPTLSAMASSGLAVSFSSGTPSVCTVSGTTLTFLSTGTCTLSASQAGNGSYFAATAVTRSFTVNAVPPGAPTITGASPGEARAWVSFNAPTSDGGAPITGYTATATPGGATASCSSNGCTFTILTNGTSYTFSVTATNSAGTGPASAPSNEVTPQAVQTIIFDDPGEQTFGTTPTLSATTTAAGLVVSFSSSTPDVCTVSGTTLTFLTTGTCTINADQAGTAAVMAAKTVTQSFPVKAPVPTVTGISPSGGKTAGGTTVTITGTGFTGATQVTIGGATATGVRVTNATTLTATLPVGSAGKADVSVTTPGGTSTGSGLYTYLTTLTVTRPQGGTVTWSEHACGTDYANCTQVFPGGSVTLTATPDSGYYFSSWGGACSGTGSCTVSMTGDRTVTATFKPIIYSLTIIKTGSGTVTSNDDGNQIDRIQCGIQCTGQMSGSVPLTAQPGYGYELDSWSGCTPDNAGGCTVIMTGNLDVSVTFKPIIKHLTYSTIGNGRVSGDVPICRGTCVVNLVMDSRVTLTALPMSGSEF